MPTAPAYNLTTGMKARREELVTIVQWGTTPETEAIGDYCESSAIEFNADKSKITDILGIVRSELRKTEPTQSVDTYYAIGGSKLGAYLTDAVLRNNLNLLEGQFTVYICYKAIGTTGAYFAVKHAKCTITPDSIGGDGGGYVNMPLTIDFSNDITVGTVNGFDPSTFQFTPESSSGTG